jgi:hypothetical protein
MMLRSGGPDWLDRLRQRLGMDSHAPWEYRATGERIDEPGYRWEEFAIVEER